MNFLKKLVIKYLIPNKEELFMMGLKWAVDEYFKRKDSLAAWIAQIIGKTPLADTATAAEIKILQDSIEEWFQSPTFTDKVIPAVGAIVK